jgi:putative ABC transport system permease protein
MTVLWQDLRYGVRMLARSPGFALVVVAILAIGIGANTAIFSIVNTVLLQALPYHDPGRIVEVEEERKDEPPRFRHLSHRTFVYWREHNHVFDHMAGQVRREMSLTGLGESFQLSTKAVSPCFFSLVGVSPKLGRGFAPEEGQPGRQHVVVVSHAFWRDHLGGDAQAIGKRITADGENYTVIGVMPAGFRESSAQAEVALWMPLVLDPTQAETRMVVWARLKRGMGLERARADMAVLQQQLAQADPPYYAGYNVTVERLPDVWLGSERKLLYPMWGAVALVLLIACMNVAGLFLVRADARRQEMATRVTLGASRGRILAQLLTESLLLSLTGGALGVLAAFWMIKGIVAVCPKDVSDMGATRIDGTVLFFTLGLSLTVGLVFGLLPAWKAGGTRPVRTLRDESSGPVIDRAWRRLCNGLVVVQIALALTLLVGVGMLIQSLVLLQREDLGFVPKNVAVMRVELPRERYPLEGGSQASLFVRQLLRRVQALPQVRSAAAISPNLLLGAHANRMSLTIDGRPPDPEANTWAKIQIVSADFFTTLGMRVLQGRGFTELDMQSLWGAAKGVVIGESLARKYFSGRNPLGRQIGVGGRDGGPVLGVVTTLKDYEALDPDVVSVYWPLYEDYCWAVAEIVVKTEGNPLRVAPVLQALAMDLDREVKVSPMETIEQRLSPMLAPRRFAIVLVGAFAQIALVVAALGLYGLLQYSVARRTHEIGVRMALGATRGQIVRTVLRQGGRLILVGVGFGLGGGYAISRIVTGLLYKAGPASPVMLALVLTTLLVAALAACYLPARRAARVDPMVALRCE